jgi:hypothetical protein
MLESQSHGAKLSIIAEHVNGLNILIGEGKFAEGKAAGIREERDTPMSPTKDKQS